MRWSTAGALGLLLGMAGMVGMVGCKTRTVYVDDDALCLDVHTDPADGVLDGEPLADAPTTAADATADVSLPPSWLDPCGVRPHELGSPAPLPANALPVLGNACAKPGWPSPPAATELSFSAVTDTALGPFADHASSCLLWQDFNGDAQADLLLIQVPPVNPPGQPARVVVLPGNGLGGWKAPVVTNLPNLIQVGDCAPVDFDGDGFADLALASDQGIGVYRNASDGTFIDQSSKLTSVPKSAKAMAFSVAASDADRDGDLDLYAVMTGQLGLVCGTFTCEHADLQYYQCCQVGLKPGCATQLPDKMQTYTCCAAKPQGVPNFLLRNDGEGGFAVAGKGVEDPNASLSASTFDVDRDGWPDFFLGNDFGPISWLRNQSKLTYEKHTTDWGLRPYGHVMGSVVADFDRDGWADAVTADFGPLTLYRGNAKGFVNDSQAAGVQTLTADSVGWALLAEDLDNDGWLDLVSTQSMVGKPGLLGEAVNCKPDSLVAGVHLLFKNQGKAFAGKPLPWAPGATPTVNPTVVAANDYDLDGDLDLALLSPPDRLQVLRNDTAQGHWLKVVLSQTESPPDGVGALVQVWAGGHVQERQLQVTPGFGAHTAPLLHFGLGGVAKVDQVRVWWPSGRVSLIGQTEVDQELVVSEVQSFGNEPQPTDGGASTDTASADASADAGTSEASTAECKANLAADLSTLPGAPFVDISAGFGFGGEGIWHGYCTVGADLDNDGDDDFLLLEAQMTPPAAAKWRVRTYLLQAGQAPNVVSTKLKYEDSPEVSETGSTGCNAADLNGDGLLDLMLGHSSGMTVLENQGSGNWQSKTAEYVTALNAYGWAMAAGDLDHTPGLEVYVGAGALPVEPPQCGFLEVAANDCDFTCQWLKPPLQNLSTNDLILRRVNGNLMNDVTASYPQVPLGGFATTPAMVDIDRDGWLDIAVGNDFGDHFLLKNEKGVLVKHDADIGFRPYAHLMGWGVGDFNRDGLTDLASADAGPMLLYMQQKSANLKFVDMAEKAGLASFTHETSSWNPLVADFDHDGWEDIWLGLSAIAPGTLPELGAGIVPPNPVTQRDLYLHNEQDGTFKIYAGPKPADQQLAFSATSQSLVDVDGDGDLDVVQVRRGGFAHVLRNDAAPPGTGLTLRLKAQNSFNAFAIGALVAAEVDGKPMLRQLTGNIGYGSSGLWKIHLGLGSGKLASKVSVQWPNGKTANYGPYLAGASVPTLQQP
jgi:hypothetical protein